MDVICHVLIRAGRAFGGPVHLPPLAAHSGHGSRLDSAPFRVPGRVAAVHDDGGVIAQDTRDPACTASLATHDRVVHGVRPDWLYFGEREQMHD